MKSPLRVALGVLACALTALVYLRFLDAPFVLDDQTTVLLNPSLVDPWRLRDVVLYDRWHPLLNLSFALDSAFSGISPFGFRITNGVLHVIAVALFYGVCTRMLRDDWTSFFAAAAFGVNPLTARSTAYISARADLLFAIGVLIVVVLVRRWTETRSGTTLAAAALTFGVTLMAAPWGRAAPHGPHRWYLSTAVGLFAVAWTSRGILARSWTARACAAVAIGVLVVVTSAALARWSGG